jgi:hypothetical protein
MVRRSVGQSDRGHARPTSPARPIPPTPLQREDYLSKLERLVASLNEASLGVKFERKSLAQLIAGLQQFMEDALGVKARPNYWRAPPGARGPLLSPELLPRTPQAARRLTPAHTRPPLRHTTRNSPALCSGAVQDVPQAAGRPPAGLLARGAAAAGGGRVRRLHAHPSPQAHRLDATQLESGGEPLSSCRPACGRAPGSMPRAAARRARHPASATSTQPHTFSPHRPPLCS